jgi:hypothetical protein
MNLLRASQSTVCGLAWKRYSRQTALRDVAPALNGHFSGEAKAERSRLRAAMLAVRYLRGSI